MSIPHVTVYTDGAYSKNQGAGGWASFMTYGHHDLMLCDYVQDTTNNRMEIQAVLSSLAQLNCKCRVDIYSDSQYVVNGINLWLNNWVKRGWKSSTGNPVLNQDLWEMMFHYKKQHIIKAYWVRGHNGDPGNELCDGLALQVQYMYGGYWRNGT